MHYKTQQFLPRGRRWFFWCPGEDDLSPEGASRLRCCFLIQMSLSIIGVTSMPVIKCSPRCQSCASSPWRCSSYRQISWPTGQQSVPPGDGAVMDVGVRDPYRHDLALVIDHQMELEPKEPTHGTAAPLGHSPKTPCAVCPVRYDRRPVWCYPQSRCRSAHH